MSAIRCHKLTRRFEGRNVLDGIEWAIADGATVALLGGSGAGKTTLLRLIAGLIHPTLGHVALAEGRERVRIGMVFQNLALWPHLTARQHLLCVLSHLSARDRGPKADALLSECRLPPAVWRQRPARLSGGEAQRLALARALAVEPDILLLDEPLAHLDPPLRADLVRVLGNCLGSRRMTCILVTHTWDEAIVLCSRVAVLNGGRLVQEGTPHALYWHPTSAAIARWTGPVVELPRSLLNEGLIRLDCELVNVERQLFDAEMALVRPQQLSIGSAENPGCWRVVDARPQAGGWWTTLTCQGYQLSLLLPEQHVPDAFVHIRLRVAPDLWSAGDKKTPSETLKNC